MHRIVSLSTSYQHCFHRVIHNGVASVLKTDTVTMVRQHHVYRRSAKDWSPPDLTSSSVDHGLTFHGELEGWRYPEDGKLQLNADPMVATTGARRP